MRITSNSLRRFWSAALLVTAEILTFALPITVPTSAAAQFFEFPFFEHRRRSYQPREQWNPWRHRNQPRRERSPGIDASNAPPPRKQDTPPTMRVVVMGDTMAEWLAYGLEEAFAETPELGVIRKHRSVSGLIRSETRNEPYDWPQAAREIVATEKPDFIVMMIGHADRVAIRERRAAAQQRQTGQRPGGQPAQASPTPSVSKAADPQNPSSEPPSEQRPGDSPPLEDRAAPSAPEPAGPAVNYEFRSEKWADLYAKRVDETVAARRLRGRVGRLRRRRRRLHAAGPGFRRADAPAARKRRGALHQGGRAQTCPLCRTRNPTRHGGAHDPGRAAGSAGTAAAAPRIADGHARDDASGRRTGRATGDGLGGRLQRRAARWRAIAAPSERSARNPRSRQRRTGCGTARPGGRFRVAAPVRTACARRRRCRRTGAGIPATRRRDGTHCPAHDGCCPADAAKTYAQAVGPRARERSFSRARRSAAARTYSSRSLAVRVAAAVVLAPFLPDCRRSARPCAHRGNDVDPMRNASTEAAAWRPSRIAQTTSDCPRRISPAANTLGSDVPYVVVSALTLPR